LLSRRIDVASASDGGMIEFQGNADGRMMLDWLIATFDSVRSRRDVRGSMAGALTRWLASDS
jgi:hypothetical protein